MPGWLTWLYGRRLSAKQLNAEIEAALAKLGVRHYDEDLFEQSHEWLRREFPRDTKRILASRYFRNVIWQVYEKIQAATSPEEYPEFYVKHDYIRGLWYYLKPRIDHLPEFKVDSSGRVNEALQVMVKAGVFSYADFHFRDDAAANRKVGPDNPHIFLVAEKDGFQSLMFDLFEDYGCNVVTFGGTPGFMSTSLFVSEIVATHVDVNQTFVCISIVDFDPKGTIIERSFIRHLHGSGVRDFQLFAQYANRPKPDPYLDLIRPQNLPDGVSYLDVQYNLPKSQRSKIWGFETGGVNGRGDSLHGIEADEFRTPHIHKLVAAAIAPYLKVPVLTVQKRMQLRHLHEILKDFAVYKLTHPESHTARARTRQKPRVPGTASARSSRLTHGSG